MKNAFVYLFYGFFLYFVRHHLVISSKKCNFALNIKN